MSRPQQSFNFPRFRLDLRAGLLFRGDEKISLRPKTFDTLICLLRHQGRLIPKEELGIPDPFVYPSELFRYPT